MEHIIDTKAQGSAILAYGKVQKTRRFWKWLTIGLIVFIVLVFLGVWVLLGSLSVELPSNRLLLVALKPSVVRSKLPSGLIPDLPPPWRAALRTDSRLPAFIGVSRNASEEVTAFALVYRHHAVVPSDELSVSTFGLMKLLTDGSSNTKRDRVHVSELFKLQRRLRSHDAAWKIEARELVRVLLNKEGVDDVVFGTWDGHDGVIELPSTNLASVASPNAPITITLGRDRSEAEPVVSALASQGIDLRTVDRPPSVIFISPEGRDVRLGWEDPISPDDQKLVLGALGIANLKEYELPDETVVREYVPSLEHISSVSGSLFSSKGVSGIPHTDKQGDCPGVLRLGLNGEVLQNLLEDWKIPRSWREYVSSIQIREEKNHANICINK